MQELKIRGGTEDNSMITSYFSIKTYVLTPNQNGVDMMILMRVHKKMLLWKKEGNYL